MNRSRLGVLGSLLRVVLATVLVLLATQIPPSGTSNAQSAQVLFPTTGKLLQGKFLDR
ncbi:MAG: hypothetical protein ABI670_21685 [Chloroflexota bacterium]